MKARLSGNTNSRGIATLEILIAFAIAILCIGAVILVVFGNQSVAIDTQINNEALYKAKQLLEDTRAISRFDFNLVNPTTATEASGGITFTKNLEVRQVDLFTKQATSTVSWISGGRNLSVFFTTFLTSPEIVNGGDTCRSDVSGFDWKHPKIITNKNGTYCENGKDTDGHNCEDGYEFGKDILNDTSSGFPVTSIQSFNKKMYVTVNNTKGNNPGTFFILDISQPKDKPVLLSPKTFDNSSAGEGLNAVVIDGKDYAYVANGYSSAPSTCSNNSGTNKSCGQLQVIRITDPTLPPSPDPIKYTLKIPSYNTSDDLAPGISIFYKNGIIYLGLANAETGEEFFTIDVGGGGSGGSPTIPKILDSFEIGNGVNSILVKNGYAYVMSPNVDELKILNVSNPSDIQAVGNFNSPSGAGNGKSVYSVGNKLYIGVTAPNAGADFHILNNTNPASTLTEIGPGLNSASSINGILVRDFLAFLVTNTELQIWDVSDPTNIIPYAPSITLPPGSGGVQGSATDCEDNYIFIGSQKTASGAGGQDKGYISVITAEIKP